jgi:hypothetical protein
MAREIEPAVGAVVTGEVVNELGGGLGWQEWREDNGRAHFHVWVSDEWMTRIDGSHIRALSEAIRVIKALSDVG